MHLCMGQLVQASTVLAVGRHLIVKFVTLPSINEPLLLLKFRQGWSLRFIARAQWRKTTWRHVTITRWQDGRRLIRDFTCVRRHCGAKSCRHRSSGSRHAEHSSCRQKYPSLSATCHLWRSAAFRTPKCHRPKALFVTSFNWHHSVQKQQILICDKIFRVFYRVVRATHEW